MSRVLAGASAVTAALLFLSGCASTETAPTVNATSFVNAHVVDLQSGSILPNQTVIIAGTKIVRMGPSAVVRPARGGRVVQASGKYLMPGLWDAHAHLSYGGTCVLPVMIAHGITGVRDLGGNLSEVRAWQTSINDGRLVGPTIKAAGPNIEIAPWIDGARQHFAADPKLRGYTDVLDMTPRVRAVGPQDARTIVAQLQRQGVDIVKFRNLSGETFLALANETQKRGMLLAGHRPKQVTLAEAAQAGQDSFEHSDAMTGGLENLSPTDRRSVLLQVGATGAMMTPTLVSDFSGSVGEDKQRQAVEVPAAHPYIGKRMRRIWELAYITRDLNPEVADWPTRMKKVADLLVEAKSAGVRVMAGTDFGTLLVDPGSSLHQELELLVEYLDMTPVEALRASAYNTPLWLGLAGQRGLITEGRVGDMVLLDSNPLTHIHNTRSIVGVAAEGRWFDRRAIDRMLSQARTSIAAGEDCTGIIVSD